jgi:peptide/nickel transport system substrate-binding protein
VKKILKIFSRSFNVRFLETLEKKLKSASLTERVIFFILIISLLLSTISIIWKINESFMVEVPSSGGKLIEGVIGLPRFINPLLANSNTDKDLTSLVYSGLLRNDPELGLIPDLAEKYEISEDNLIYSFTLKEGLTFQDGAPLTTDDIEFTIEKTQDNLLKSPQRVIWDGVTVNKIDKLNIQLILKQPYSPFLENTTLGILPKHLWNEITSEQFAFSRFNTEPIGAGPYRFLKTKRDTSGIFKSYSLVSFSKYSLGEPYLSEIIFKFYSNQETLIEAYEAHNIESAGAIPPKAIETLKRSGVNIKQATLPRVFGVFFNQNQSAVLLNDEVRKALNISVDRERIVQEVFDGYALPLEGPLPQSKYSLIQTDPSEKLASSSIEIAREILANNKWKLNDEGFLAKKTALLKFTIATSNAPELKAAAKIIKENWTELGADVELQIFETSDLNQDVIRPREYDTLLFGEVINRSMDLFAFWHSSQRNDPGLNIAMYANITTDKLLNDIRETQDEKEKETKYKELQKEIAKDIPAVFLYSPNFIYLIPAKIKNVNLTNLNTSTDRFANIHKWYIKTNKVWRIFSQ